jgi:1-acyl-sn-glycerol-3-phosphate acyltransferase
VLKTIRIIALILWFIISILLILMISIFRPSNPDNLWMFSILIGKGAKVILGIDYEVDVDFDFVNDRPSVIIANHQNIFDIFMISYLKPRYTVSLGKKELLYIPLFGIFYYLTGNVLINRKNRTKALSSMRKVRKTITEKKLNIIIMPEGTRSRGKGLLPFKKGAFFTAINSQVPIIPLCFSSWDDNINLNKIKSGVIKISSLPPITTKGLSKSDLTNILNTSYEQMTNKLSKLNN